MDDDPLSPSERSIFEDLEGVISEELVVQMSIGRFDEPGGEQVVASLVADAIWERFHVQPRP